MDSAPSSPESPSKRLMSPGSTASAGAGAGANMKVRIGFLEDALDDQLRKNDMIDSRLDDVMSEVDAGNDRIMAKLQENKDKFDDALNNLRKEFGHKFELQMAENQRTQQHIASLKADKAALQRKLATAVERLRAVEMEVTGEDIGPADDFNASGNISASASGTGLGLGRSASSGALFNSPNRDNKTR